MNAVLDDMPDGSALEVIEGAFHVAFLGKPYYRDFQDRLIGFPGSVQRVDEKDNAYGRNGRSSLMTTGQLYDIESGQVVRVNTGGNMRKITTAVFVKIGVCRKKPHSTERN